MNAVCRASIVIGLGLVVGCGPAKPTRSQALQDYKTELELLDRLEAQHKAMGAKYDAELAEMENLVGQMSNDSMRQEAIGKITPLRKAYMDKLLEDKELVVDPQRERVREAAEVLNSLEPKKSAK